ncbi:alanine racemase [soil metagenome]
MPKVKEIPSFLETYAEINLRDLLKNYDLIQDQASKRFVSGKQKIKICSVVKANAYGHGMIECSEALTRHGTDYLGTADLNESMQLRYELKKKKLHPKILCLGIIPVKKHFLEEVINSDIEVSLIDLKRADILNKIAKNLNTKVKVQVQVDTGMNRIGVRYEDAYDLIGKIAKMKNLELNGIYSHFTSSEDGTDAFSVKQKNELKSLIREVELNIQKVNIRHIENSGGFLNQGDDFFNMIRPGITLYGYYPDRKKIKQGVKLIPVMTLKSKVEFIKKVRKNETVSYGRKYYFKSDRYIGSIPLGYGDGYPRGLSDNSKVMINNKLYSIRGTVCMDWIMADLGNKTTVKTGDDVTIFGKEFPVFHKSEAIGTIPYEITTLITPRVKRVYIN